MTFWAQSSPDYSNTALFGKKNDIPDVGIIELNSYVLDGTRQIAESDFKLPFYSTQMSNADAYNENCILYGVVLDSDATIGFDFEFYEDYPDEVIVTWVRGNIVLESKSFKPTSTKFFLKAKVENFQEITIEMKKSMKPFQSTKIKSLTFGKIFEWADDDLSSGSVNEEVDTTGATLPINTATVEIVDRDNDFNVINPNGIWKSVLPNQEMIITEYVNGKEVPIGYFYLKTWANKDNVTSFELQDRIGLLDEIKFVGGMYENEYASKIIERIIDTARATADRKTWPLDCYNISPVFADVKLSGYLPIMPCREALHQVAFAMNAVVDDSRGNKINIYPPDRNVDSYILTSRKFSGGTVAELDDYVSGVTIACKKYVAKSESTEIFRGTLEKGEHRIEFSQPYTSLNVTNARIEADGANFVVVKLTQTAEVVINGVGFDTTDFAISKTVSALEKGQKENIKTFGNITLYNVNILNDIAERLFKWFGLRQKVSIEYICDSEKVGEWVGIQDATNNARYAISCINTQSIDLVGGFTAKAECRGYSNETAVYSAMGNNELNMNGEELI